MNYYSTNNRSNKVTFRNALMQGLAADKGLYMPNNIPSLDFGFLNNLQNYTFQEIAFEVSNMFIEEEISAPDLEKIIASSISFEAPLIKLSNNLHILELFHGPTLAFKDFGARFMARTMEHFLKTESKEITILVATSGDTGSAVANGFFNVDGINVIVLFPKGKISKFQEKQITTLGHNIKAVAIDGTFDDCQKIVKQAFTDDTLIDKINLSSANSINIGRLIPQSFYYFESFKMLEDITNVVYSVPSGNLGNLTAGLFAKNMGLPIKKFIAATNSNDVFTKFIHSGKFNSHPSVQTLSNAMDVGDPSNLARIIDLYDNNHSNISDVIYSQSFSDSDTIDKMKFIKDNYGYTIDPHGAVGCLALDNYFDTIDNNSIGVVLETAHPAKFMDVFTENSNITPEIPERLKSCLDKPGISEFLSNNYSDFKSFLLD
jgi:threonine synthase